MLPVALLLACTPGAQALRVVTVNLQGMRPDSNWQVRQYFLHQALIALDPDVVCLQEVCETLSGGGADNQALALAHSLETALGGDYTWYFQATHIGWEQFNEGVGLVTRLPLLESGTISLTPGAFPRKVVWNRLQSGEGELQVFSTHLDHLSSAVRLVQAGEVRDFVMEKVAAHPGSPAILGGDFNSTPASAAMRLFTVGHPDSLFVDAWAMLHPGEAGWTMPSDAPNQRIDYLLSLSADPSWAPVLCELAITETYDGTHFPSDHFAVRADYEEGVGLVDPEPALPQTAELGAPFPNPFNPAVSLPVELLRATARLRLEVVDVRGVRRALLHDGALDAGKHTFTWRPHHEAAGLYLARLTDGEGRVSTRKLLHLP